MKTAFSIMCLLTAWFARCAVVPIPSDGKTHGKVMTRKQAQFIVPGQTTLAEVTEKLGDQFRDSPWMPVLAYAWEISTIGWGWAVANPPPQLESFFSQHERNEGIAWQAFLGVFDGIGKVSRTKFVPLSGGKFLDEQLEDWARRNGAAAFTNYSLLGQ